MFSLVVPTCRDIDALKPLFINSSNDAEIIIIDSNYNEKTKEQLQQLDHNYKKIIYAPPKQREQNLPYDMMSAINTGIAYSEYPWIMKIDDNWELKPDFFERAKENIKRFSKDVVIRPVELEPWNNDIKWKSFIQNESRYFRLPHPPLGRPIPIQTIGQAIYHIDTMYDLNGWDERYDQGLGWNDNDLFERFLAGNYPIMLDRELMIYRYEHLSTGSHEKRDIAMQIFMQNMVEIKKGNYRVPNPFDLKELHQKMLKEKPRYEI